jgi:hypothetical protein
VPASLEPSRIPIKQEDDYDNQQSRQYEIYDVYSDRAHTQHSARIEQRATRQM